MDIYREEILDHYKNPRNSGQIKDPDCQSELDNPLCGDMIKVFVQLEQDIIKEIKYQAEGCSVSVATISMLSERIKGLPKKQVMLLNQADVLAILGIPLSATRLQCAMLGLTAIQNCLNQNNK